MSQSHFVRKSIISACSASLDDIYSFRAKKLHDAAVALAVFDKEVDNRNWWRKLSACHMRDGFARCRLLNIVETVSDWHVNQEKRLQIMLSFCIALEDETISITAQEFKDFSRFYRG